MEKMSKNVVSYKFFQRNVENLILQSKITKQVLTVFSSLEFSTLQKQEIFEIQYNEYKLNEYEFQSFDEINNCLETFKQTIKQKIPKEFLKEKYKKIKDMDFKYFTHSGIIYLNQYINIIDERYEELIESFYVDRFSQFNINRFSIQDRQRFITACTQVVMDIICNKWSMGGLRIICKILKEIKKESQLKGELNRKSIYWNIIQSGDQIIKRLKSEGDLVDCEFIHLACFGFRDEKCYCYTTDKKQVIIDRLILYCTYVHFLIWMFFDSKTFKTIPQDIVDQYRQQYKRPELKCGKVFILNKDTGEKISEIFVQEIYDEIKASSVLK